MQVAGVGGDETRHVLRPLCSQLQVMAGSERCRASTEAQGGH